MLTHCKSFQSLKHIRDFTALLFRQKASMVKYCFGSEHCKRGRTAYWEYKKCHSLLTWEQNKKKHCLHVWRAALGATLPKCVGSTKSIWLTMPVRKNMSAQSEDLTVFMWKVLCDLIFGPLGLCVYSEPLLLWSISKVCVTASNQPPTVC